MDNKNFQTIKETCPNEMMFPNNQRQRKTKIFSEVPVVEVSPKEQLLDLLSCLPWTGARARLVPRLGFPFFVRHLSLRVCWEAWPPSGLEVSWGCTVPPWLAPATKQSKLLRIPQSLRFVLLLVRCQVQVQTLFSKVVDLLGLEGRLVESTPDSERWLESDEKPFAVVRDFSCVQ